MTQRELAAALQVNIKTVDNWENGRTSPRSSIGALEEVLGIRFDEPEPGSSLSPRLVDMIRRTLPPEDWDRVIRAIEEIVDGPTSPGAAARSLLAG